MKKIYLLLIVILFICPLLNCGPDYRIEVKIVLDDSFQTEYNSGSKYLFAIYNINDLTTPIYSKEFTRSGNQTIKGKGDNGNEIPSGWDLYPVVYVCTDTLCANKVLQGTLYSVDPQANYNSANNTFGIFSGEIATLYLAMGPVSY